MAFSLRIGPLVTTPSATSQGLQRSLFGAPSYQAREKPHSTPCFKMSGSARGKHARSQVKGAGLGKRLIGLRRETVPLICIHALAFQNGWRAAAASTHTGQRHLQPPGPGGRRCRLSTRRAFRGRHLLPLPLTSQPSFWPRPFSGFCDVSAHLKPRVVVVVGTSKNVCEDRPNTVVNPLIE